jgi:hypothetical protein
VAFLANTMIAARNVHKNVSQRMGPGGRPLPMRSRSSNGYRQTQQFSKTVKRFFNWLSVGILITWLADAVIFIAHALVARSEHWWQGQSVVVCARLDKKKSKKLPKTNSDHRSASSPRSSCIRSS